MESSVVEGGTDSCEKGDGKIAFCEFVVSSGDDLGNFTVVIEPAPIEPSSSSPSRTSLVLVPRLA